MTIKKVSFVSSLVQKHQVCYDWGRASRDFFRPIVELCKYNVKWQHDRL